MSDSPEAGVMFPVLQIPGGVELLVIFVIVVLLFGIPLAIVALAVVLLRGSRGDGDVEAEVRALREEVAELRASMQAGGEAPGGAESADDDAVADRDPDEK